MAKKLKLRPHEQVGNILADMHATNGESLWWASQALDPCRAVKDQIHNSAWHKFHRTFEVLAAVNLPFGIHEQLRSFENERGFPPGNKSLVVVDSSLDGSLRCAYSYDGTRGGTVLLRIREEGEFEE